MKVKPGDIVTVNDGDEPLWKNPGATRINTTVCEVEKDDMLLVIATISRGEHPDIGDDTYVMTCSNSCTGWIRPNLLKLVR